MSMKISVFGLGYVGTVTVACLADQGHEVWGVDINSEKVKLIREGISPIIEPGLPEKLEKGIKGGRIKVTMDAAEALVHSEVTFIIVATPSGPLGQIDPTYIYRVCEQIAQTLKELKRSQVVVIRSSILPEIFKSCLEIFNTQAEGLVELASNPEFLREGNAINDFDNPPFTIIGTSGELSETALREIYAGIEAPIHVLKPLEAVMVKYASNVFHGLKITFANEIGALCKSLSIDPHVVMSTFIQDRKLNISKQYLQPGFAFGGSCLPKDTRAIVNLARQNEVNLPVISSILTSNAEVIGRAYETIIEQGKGRIGFIGLSFKENSDDLRESPLLELVHRLSKRDGTSIRVYDPKVSQSLENQMGRSLIEKAVPNIDELLVNTLDELLAFSEVLVVGHPYEEIKEQVTRLDRTVIVLDFCFVPGLRESVDNYQGINW